MTIRKITAALLLAALLTLPASAQSITCTPQPNGTTICENTPRTSGRRLAVVAAVAVGVAVVVYLVHRHKKHADPQPRDTNPQPAPTGAER